MQVEPAIILRVLEWIAMAKFIIKVEAKFTTYNNTQAWGMISAEHVINMKRHHIVLLARTKQISVPRH